MNIKKLFFLYFIFCRVYERLFFIQSLLILKCQNIILGIFCCILCVFSLSLQCSVKRKLCSILKNIMYYVEHALFRPSVNVHCENVWRWMYLDDFVGWVYSLDIFSVLFYTSHQHLWNILSWFFIILYTVHSSDIQCGFNYTFLVFSITSSLNLFFLFCIEMWDWIPFLFLRLVWSNFCSICRNRSLNCLLDKFPIFSWAYSMLLP